MSKHAESKKERIVVADGPDYVLFGVAVVLWLLPITWVGLTKTSVPYAGIYANDMYRVGALFTKRLTASVDYYFQVQTEDDWEWIDVPKRDYASIVMSGNRTRLDRVLSDSYYSPRGMAQRQSIAEFIKHRHEKQNSSQSNIESVRFIYVLFPVGGKMAQAKRKWMEWPIRYIPEERRIEMSTHYFDGRPGRNSLAEMRRKGT